MDEHTIQTVVTEYLEFHKMQETLAKFKEEAKNPYKKYKDEELAGLPKIYTMAKGSQGFLAREAVKDKQIKVLEKNYTVTLNAGKQLVALGVDAVQKLAGFEETKEGAQIFKEQLTRYYQLFVNDSRMDEREANDTLSEAKLKSVKTSVQSALRNRDFSNLKDSLMAVRQAALSVPARQRRRVLEKIIAADVFAGSSLMLVRTVKDDLKVATLALMCMIAASPAGVVSLLKGSSEQLAMKLFEVLTSEPLSSLCQRFVLGLLQKITVWHEPSCNALIEAGCIQHITREVLEVGIVHKEYVHSYCLDFASALLANLVNYHYGLAYLESRQSDSLRIMDNLLTMISSEGVESSAIIHLLIVLTAVSNDRFAYQMEEVNFIDRISEFVEIYSTKTTDIETEDPENRKIILDMCAHLFHPRDSNSSMLNTSEVMEFNAKKHQDEVNDLERKLQDEHEVIVFECFPDEDLLGD